MKSLYGKGSDDDERTRYISFIRNNVQQCVEDLVRFVADSSETRGNLARVWEFLDDKKDVIGNVTQFRTLFKAEIAALMAAANRARRFGGRSKFEFSSEFASNVETVWRSEFLKAVHYAQSMLTKSGHTTTAAHFLDKIVDVAEDEYLADEQDVLALCRPTTGLCVVLYTERLRI